MRYPGVQVLGIINRRLSIGTVGLLIFMLATVFMPVNAGFSSPEGGGSGPVVPALRLTCPNEPDLIFDQAVGYCIPLPEGVGQCPSGQVYDSRVGQCVVPDPAVSIPPWFPCDPATEVYDQATDSCVQTGAMPQVDPCEDPSVVIEGCPQISSEETPPPPSEVDNVDNGEQPQEDNVDNGEQPQEDNVDNGEQSEG